MRGMMVAYSAPLRNALQGNPLIPEIM